VGQTGVAAKFLVLGGYYLSYPYYPIYLIKRQRKQEREREEIFIGGNLPFYG
jgi:hypothetical protein